MYPSNGAYYNDDLYLTVTLRIHVSIGSEFFRATIVCNQHNIFNIKFVFYKNIFKK